MNCHLCQKELDAYREEKLSDGMQIQVKAHLESCPGCSESYQLLILANDVMEAEKETLSNPFLVTRIMDGIEEMDKNVATYWQISSVQRVLKPILISASLAAAIFLGVLVGNIYFPTNTTHKIPVELSYMNDAALESVDIYSQL